MKQNKNDTIRTKYLSNSTLSVIVLDFTLYIVVFNVTFTHNVWFFSFPFFVVVVGVCYQNICRYVSSTLDNLFQFHRANQLDNALSRRDYYYANRLNSNMFRRISDKVEKAVAILLLLNKLNRILLILINDKKTTTNSCCCC